MYFFVNDTLNGLGNQFYFEYDDVQITRIFGEVSTQIGPDAWIFLKANYYHYGMSVQAHAWNKPDFDATVVARYNFRKKMMFELEAYYVGKRYAKSYEFARPEIALDGFVDMNFKAEYQFTKLLSFYLTLNNILGKGYEIWNQYPVQKFSIFAGFTYTL
jgi:outer membrane cobalamin receptor